MSCRPWLRVGPLQIILPWWDRWITVLPKIEIGKSRDQENARKRMPSRLM